MIAILVKSILIIRYTTWVKENKEWHW